MGKTERRKGREILQRIDYEAIYVTNRLES